MFAFVYRCIYDKNFPNIRNNETVDITICDNSLGLYEKNEEIKKARQIDFILNEIVKLIKKVKSKLSHINIRCSIYDTDIA